MLAVSTLLVLTVASGVLSAPFHASCKVDWEISGKCDAAKMTMLSQIKAMSGASGCANGGEKCLYKLVSDSGMKVTATHETPTKHYVDDLTFTFTQSGDVCKVHGYSTSETWYAILDHSTNYCNMRNLITGANLHKAAGFKETTSNSVCTQYSTADCSKY